MPKSTNAAWTAITLLLLAAATNQGCGSQAPVKTDTAANAVAVANDYPSLTDKELGHVRWLVKLAEQPFGDWSHMGGKEAGQEGLEAYRYQLGYMAYALALAQYHKTPAYRELYQRAMDRMIQKMVRRDVWSYWEHVSKGSKTMNPAMKRKGAGWLDPVADKNIMYSGHLVNMVELYQMLYRDDKYDQPGAITFRWEWMGELLDEFKYDGDKLAAVIHRQFADNPHHMIECELNMIFPVCNQPPLLGLMLYDHNHGTGLAPSVKGLVAQAFEDDGLLDPQTRDFLQFYMVEQKMPVGPASPGNNAFVAISMHAWNPELVEKIYPLHARRVREADAFRSGLSDNNVGLSSAPIFAAYAKEMGDGETAAGLAAWMEAHCAPRWVDGKYYYYPRDDELGITPLFTVAAALAEINVKDGVWALYNRPWRDDYFAQPFISGVAHPQVVVRQAFYDREKAVLAVTLEPGDQSGGQGAGKTAFAVNQLDPSKNWSVTRNGKAVGRLDKGVATSTQAGALAFKDGVLTVATELDRPQSFLIRGE